jgi:hypothetical protein
LWIDANLYRKILEEWVSRNIEDIARINEKNKRTPSIGVRLRSNHPSKHEHSDNSGALFGPSEYNQQKYIKFFIIFIEK